MSERRKVETCLRQASFNIDAAKADLQEAQQLLDSYDFLKRTNPFLVRQIQVDLAELETLSAGLFEAEVAP